MPGGFPLGLELCNANDQGTVTATTTGTPVTSGLANTYGSWTQLVASTPNDTCWLVVQLLVDVSAYQSAVQIGVGSAGNELLIAADLVNYSNSNTSHVYQFPCNIPAGTRISARLISPSAADVAHLTVVLLDGAFTQIEGAAGVDSIGFVAASSQGTTVTAATGSKGSYAQLSASTARDYMGFLIATDGQGAPITNVFTLLDVAIGASGSEQVILPNIFQLVDGAVKGPFYIPIPAGTRVAVRLQAFAGTPIMGVTLYGIYQ